MLYKPNVEFDQKWAILWFGNQISAYWTHFLGPAPFLHFCTNSCIHFSQLLAAGENGES